MDKFSNQEAKLNAAAFHDPKKLWERDKQLDRDQVEKERKPATKERIQADRQRLSVMLATDFKMLTSG